MEAVAFEVAVDGVFVFFGYVENEGTQPRVVVGVVLAVDGGAADSDDDAGFGFAYFDGGGVDGRDLGLLMSWC